MLNPAFLAFLLCWFRLFRLPPADITGKGRVLKWQVGKREKRQKRKEKKRKEKRRKEKRKERLARSVPRPQSHRECMGLDEDEYFEEESDKHWRDQKNLSAGLVEAHTRLSSQSVCVNAPQNGPLHRSRWRIDQILSHKLHCYALIYLIHEKIIDNINNEINIGFICPAL